MDTIFEQRSVRACSFLSGSHMTSAVAILRRSRRCFLQLAALLRHALQLTKLASNMDIAGLSTQPFSAHFEWIQSGCLFGV